MKKPASRWPLEPMDNIDIAPEFDCPAIRRCCAAWYDAYQKAQAAGTHPVSVRMRANEAYRFAMPPLNIQANLPDFIACVVHGMMVGAIIDELGTRWVHAAQVAAGMFKATSKPGKADNQTEGSTQNGKTPTPPPSRCLTVYEGSTPVFPYTCT